MRSPIEVLRERLDLAGSYRRVFNTPDGERVLRHLMKVGRVTRSSFVAGDPHQTSLNEGKRLLVLSILRIVRRDEGELLKQVERTIDDENTIDG